MTRMDPQTTATATRPWIATVNGVADERIQCTLAKAARRARLGGEYVSIPSGPVRFLGRLALHRQYNPALADPAWQVYLTKGGRLPLEVQDLDVVDGRIEVLAVVNAEDARCVQPGWPPTGTLIYQASAAERELIEAPGR